MPPPRFSSDQGSARLETAQETLDDGPCRDATATGQPIHAADLTHPSWRERWPRFTPAALAAGARAVFALPLHAGGIHHAGAVDLYRRTPGELHKTDQHAATAFAAAAAELLTLERLGLDWTDAFARARSHPTRPSANGGPPATAPTGPADAITALPLVCWFNQASLPLLRRRLHAASTAHDLPDQHAHRFVLAAHEAMTNAVQHGGGHGQLLMWQRAGHLWCEISDHGPGIGATLRSTRDPRTRTRLRRPHGFGLIQRACTAMDITTDPTGTRLQLSYYLGR
ncbi:ATP-binding protein [Actinoplanes sp. NEAU-A12]|uniref:ATP-binding protein n=1 Tax=Actinoplanes sandaracinus TaxID=3045177 RepID=A0ABT6WX75_9ACTN|nr:ATP-binding protein [Actinoplanes sandaracinus]MDI6104341.1 ATP-binding protein [Actinoplanes sandaracinus]